MRARATVTTLSAIAIGTGLLGLALSAADRAVEQRRRVARHIAIGMSAARFAALSCSRSLDRW